MTFQKLLRFLNPTHLSFERMKRIFVEISVSIVNGSPSSFEYLGVNHVIQSIDNKWIVQGKWWSKEEKRVYFRVHTQKGVAVIFQKQTALPQSKYWVLEEIFD